MRIRVRWDSRGKYAGSVAWSSLLSLGLKITPFAMRIWIHMKEPRQKIFRGMESNKDSSLEWCCQVEIEHFHLSCNFSEKMKFCWYRTSGVGENWIFFSHFLLHMCKVIKVRQWKIIMFNFPHKIVAHWRRWKIYSSQVGELSVNSINYLNNFSNHELLETLDFEQRNLEIWKTLYWRRLFNENIKT